MTLQKPQRDESIDAREVGRLHERLDGIEEKQDKLLIAIASIESRCLSCQRDLFGVQSTVYGNGDPGLKTRTERLETSRRVIWSAIGVLLAAVAAGAAVLEWLDR